MVKGNIESLGFDYEIEDKTLDDYELMEVLCEIDDDNPQLITKAFKMLLGEEQLKRLKATIKKKCGHVSTTEMMSAFSCIMENSRELKK